MNQVYFYPIRSRLMAHKRHRLNPFMNQVYFYAVKTRPEMVEQYINVLIPL